MCVCVWHEHCYGILVLQRFFDVGFSIMREQMGVCHTNTILNDCSRLWFHTEITQSKSDLSKRKKKRRGEKHSKSCHDDPFTSSSRLLVLSDPYPPTSYLPAHDP